MGLYNVIQECVIDIKGEAKHFAHPHPTPVEVDDATAAPLVEAGSLTHVEASATSPEPVAEPVAEPSPDESTDEPATEGRSFLRRNTES